MRFAGKALAVFAATLAASFVVPATAQGWKPNRPVEFIVPTPPGGGQDTPARALLKVIQEQKIVDVPMSVVNKAGASGAVGFNYLNSHAGDGHFIAMSTVPLVTNPLTGLASPGYGELTPLAMLFNEYVVFTVVADSKIANGKDLIERVRKDPTSISFGTPSIGAGPHLSIAQLARAAGQDPKKLKIVAFSGAGPGASALLGGHIDVLVSTPSAPVAHVESGKARVVGVTAQRRMSGVFAQAPTWREQGADVVMYNWRAIIGPKGLSREQIAYWEGVFDKVRQTADYKKGLEQNNWVDNPMGSDELRKELERLTAQFKVLLGDFGLLK